MKDYAVEVKSLTVEFGDFRAVDDVSFKVARGEIFGFLGANGAGKTTTIRVLCGLLIPTHGEVKVGGLDLEHGEEKLKTKVGYMSQKFTLYNDLTVEENLSFSAALRKLSDETFKRRSRELLEFISFKRPMNTIVRDLPGGTKQQLALVASMLHDPEIVFLDEPTAGVTPAARAKFWDLIRLLASKGKTVFVTTHYMDEAEQCGRIALMRAGQIIALDSPEALKTKTFPEPLFELEPLEKSADRDGWLEALKEDSAVLSLQPYGLRYHVSVKSEREWKALEKTYSSCFQARPIRPSMEDVFIRLVEGRNR